MQYTKEMIKKVQEELIEVSDISGRKSTVRKSSLKPSIWAQGNEVSTHI